MLKASAKLLAIDNSCQLGVKSSSPKGKKCNHQKITFTDNYLDNYRDQTHPKCILSKVNIGDLLYIVDCGAYSLTFSPNNFCGLARVAEVVHTNRSFILTNRRELPEEVYGRTVIKK